jgi:Xaa-Pro aminopeptidase
MADANLEALVCRLPENVLLLSGHWPLNGFSFMVFPRDGRPTLIVPHCDEREAADEAWDAELEPFLFGVLAAGPPFQSIAAGLRKTAGQRGYARVGYEASFEFTAPAWNTAENAVPAAVTHGILREVFGPDALVDATALLHDQRARKTEREVAGMRRANEIATFGIDTFYRVVEPGARGVAIAAEVERAIVTKGAQEPGVRRVRAFAQVATGAEETARGYRPMELLTTRPMAEGDIALLELAVVVDGFWADRTRVHVAGGPTDRQVEVFDTVRTAQEAAIAAVRPGITAGDVDGAARSIVEEAGLGERFIHVTGHGLGFRYHEPSPMLVPGSAERIQTGMTCTVEPGVYLEDFGGMRLEENVVVTATGAEVLGPAPKRLW